MNGPQQPRSARVVNALAFACILVAGAALGLAWVAWDRLHGAPPPPARPQAPSWPDPDPLRGGPIP